MFLFSILSSIFIIGNIFLILLVVMQKNYGGFWSGPSGSDSVMLFGGNQGADILQKLTWFFGIFLMGGALSLSIYEASSSKVSRFYIKEVVIEVKSNEDKLVDKEEKSEKEEEKKEKENQKEIPDIIQSDIKKTN